MFMLHDKYTVYVKDQQANSDKLDKLIEYAKNINDIVQANNQLIKINAELVKESRNRILTDVAHVNEKIPKPEPRE